MKTGSARRICPEKHLLNTVDTYNSRSYVRVVMLEKSEKRVKKELRVLEKSRPAQTGQQERRNLRVKNSLAIQKSMLVILH
jgi:hypothetical protein